jgi:hypothetical protein
MIAKYNENIYLHGKIVFGSNVKLREEVMV